MSETGKAGRVRDGKGRSHYVIYQTYGTTCGPACMAMVEYYHRNFPVCTKESAEARVRQISAWQEGQGTTLGTFPETLKKLGIEAELIRVRNPKTELFDKLKSCVSDRTPAIVELDHSWQTMGHVAVCRRIDADGAGVFLDPASGLVELGAYKVPFFRFNEMGKFLLSGGIIVSHLKTR